MEALKREGRKSIAFPSISCGVCEWVWDRSELRYLNFRSKSDGYPIEDATEIAIETVRSLLERPEYDNVSSRTPPAIAAPN
jgi:O-acetyl-ADP-ribose deacetylase (regulator of RNase III)